jgi:2-succinyl-6-hydroxy-2,4-cyclohexadiene-1-carboxylate synthase
MEIVIEGVQYHIETCGEGDPLLLLHGFTGDSSTWLPFCEKWGKHSKLIIPDIIGHGKTDAPQNRDRYRIESAAKDLYHILGKLDCKKVNVLGYSMGGRLALTFAVLYPEKVNKLILESSSPGLLTETERAERRMKDGELADFIKEKGMENFVDYWENIPLFSTMRNLPQKVKDMLRQQRLSHTPQGLANSLLGMGTGSQPSWWGKLDQLDEQVLLLTGEQDEKFCRIAEKMQNLLKNSTWMVVENSGHALHVEVKEKFGTIVSEFLLNT